MKGSSEIWFMRDGKFWGDRKFGVFEKHFAFLILRILGFDGGNISSAISRERGEN